MANNYCEFSEAFKLPEAAANDFIAIVDAGDDISKMPDWFVSTTACITNRLKMRS